MKKLLSLLLALVMMMSLCACGETDDYDDDEDRDEIVEEDDDKKDDGKFPFWGDKDDEDQDDTGDGDVEVPPINLPEPSVPVEPTSEEWEEIYDYSQIVSTLNNYVEYQTIMYDPVDFGLEGDIVFDAEALSAYYAMLQDLDGVDKWAGTEYANDETVNWNRQEVLDSFTVLKDVKLKYTQTEVDNLGNNKGTIQRSRWHYYENGQIKQVTSEEDTVRIHIGTGHTNRVNYASGDREYDAEGRLAKITLYSGTDIVEVCTFTYDEEGKLIKQVVQDNTSQWEINDFTYDENGRLVKYTLPFGYSDQIVEMAYTYNEDGTLASEQKNTYVTNDNGDKFIKIRYSMEYTYDAEGKLASGTYKEQTYGEKFSLMSGTTATYLWHQKVDQYAYTYDADGRIVTETATMGSTEYFNDDGTPNGSTPSSVATTTYETVYGDYCIYNPAK